MLSMVFSSSVFAAEKEQSAWDSFLGLFSAKTAATSDVGVEYRGHVQNKGDFPLDGSWIQGPDQLGTVGESLRLEAFWIKLTNEVPAGLHIQYRVHVQNKGWMAPVEDGALAGTQGESLQIESVEIKLVDDAGNPAVGYSVEYRGHIQNKGDMPADGSWYKDGEQLGTVGEFLRLEALEVKIVKTTPQADLTAYNAAVAEANAVVEADYTAESYAALQTALENNVVTADNTQAEVDAATAAINAAIDALVPVPKVTGVKAVDANDNETVLPAEGVIANSTYDVTFSTDMDATFITTSTIYLTQDGVKQLASVSYDSDTKTATLTPNGDTLTPGKAYVLTVDGAKDAEGTAVAKSTTNFTVSLNPILLTATYQNATPATTDLDGAIVNNNTEEITLTFNKDMDVNTINTTNVKIYDITDGEYLVSTVTPNVGADPAVATIENTTVFETEHDYRVEIKAGALDLAGNPMKATSINFFYGYTAPVVQNQDPADGDIDVYNSITSSGGHDAFKFRAQFSAAVDASTVNADTVEMTVADTEEVIDTTVTYEAGSRYVIVTPKADLAENTEYSVTIDGVKTDKGIAIAEDVTSFTTGDFGIPTVVSTTPANAAENVAIDANMVVNFSKAMDPATLVLATNIILEDVTAGGTEAGFNTWTSSLSQDGKTLTIKVPTNAKLDPNKTYRLTIKKTAEDTAGNALAADVKALFNTQAAAATVLTKVQDDGFAAGNAVIESGVTNITNTHTINFTFDQALKTEAGTYALENLVKIEKKNASGTFVSEAIVADTIQLVNSSKTIEVSHAWAVDSTYRVTIPTTVKDANGNNVQKVEFTFTTGPKPVVDTANSYPASFAVDVPIDAPYVAVIVDDADSDLQSSTLNTDTVKFVKTSDSSVAPYSISSINYAKKTITAGVTATTDGTTTVTLSNATNNAAVGDIITINSVTGTYVVTAKNGATLTVDRATTNGGAGDAVTFHQGVVYALNTDAELAGDTQYQLQVSGVQDKAGNTADAKNITFTTETAAADFEYVSGTVTDGATGIAVNKALEFTFNTPVDAATLTGVTVAENGVDKTAQFTIELKDGDEKTVVITPAGFLVNNKAYTVTFDTTVANTAPYGGATLATNKVIAFQTETPASVKPAIQSAVWFDLDGSETVTEDDVVRITFNTSLDTATATAADFTLTGPGVNTFGAGAAASYSSNDKVVDITLGTSPVIVPGASTVKSDGGITDGMGNLANTTAVTIVKY